MSPELMIALMNLVAKVGFDSALFFFKNLQAAKTIDDAIVALETSAKKTWDDYKKEALIPPVPPA